MRGALLELPLADVPPSRIELHRPCVRRNERGQGGLEPLEQNGVRINDQGYDVAVIFTGDITGEAMGSTRPVV